MEGQTQKAEKVLKLLLGWGERSHLKIPLCSLPGLGLLTVLLAASFALEPALILSFFFGPGCLETG